MAKKSKKLKGKDSYRLVYELDKTIKTIIKSSGTTETNLPAEEFFTKEDLYTFIKTNSLNPDKFMGLLVEDINNAKDEDIDVIYKKDKNGDDIKGDLFKEKYKKDYKDPKDRDPKDPKDPKKPK